MSLWAVCTLWSVFDVIYLLIKLAFRWYKTPWNSTEWTSRKIESNWSSQNRVGWSTWLIEEWIGTCQRVTWSVWIGKRRKLNKGFNFEIPKTDNWGFFGFVTCSDTPPTRNKLVGTTNHKKHFIEKSAGPG